MLCINIVDSILFGNGGVIINCIFGAGLRYFRSFYWNLNLLLLLKLPKIFVLWFNKYHWCGYDSVVLHSEKHKKWIYNQILVFYWNYYRFRLMNIVIDSIDSRLIIYIFKKHVLVDETFLPVLVLQLIQILNIEVTVPFLWYYIIDVVILFILTFIILHKFIKVNLFIVKYAIVPIQRIIQKVGYVHNRTFAPDNHRKFSLWEKIEIFKDHKLKRVREIKMNYWVRKQVKIF